MFKSIHLGFDPREAAAFAVARNSAQRHLTQPGVPIHGCVLEHLQRAGYYQRPTNIVINGDGRRQLIDVASVRPDYDGRMSTEHAIARFFTCRAVHAGWVLFMDSDILVRASLLRIFDGLDPDYAVYCVKHRYAPKQTGKKNHELQTNYPRKNWSSVMVWNSEHPAHQRLTLKDLNRLPGRDLHAFSWLADGEIGELDPKWNWLVGHSDPAIDPAIVHFTEGTPDMAGYENVAYADEWRAELLRWTNSYAVPQPREMRNTGA